MEQQVMNFGILKESKNLVLLLVFVPQDRVSCAPGWSQTPYVALNFLFELVIPLPLLPEFWDHRSVPPITWYWGWSQGFVTAELSLSQLILTTNTRFSFSQTNKHQWSQMKIKTLSNSSE